MGKSMNGNHEEYIAEYTSNFTIIYEKLSTFLVIHLIFYYKRTKDVQKPIKMYCVTA